MLPVEKLEEREQELVKLAQKTGENIQSLQNNIQQFQQKLGEMNTHYLILDAKIQEIQSLKFIAQQNSQNDASKENILEV